MINENEHDLDKNGYAKSIFPEPPYTDGMIRHEIYYGKNRPVSKANGFWIWLTPEMHEVIHSKNGHELDYQLKQSCQRIYEVSHSRYEFIKLIGKNYL